MRLSRKSVFKNTKICGHCPYNRNSHLVEDHDLPGENLEQGELPESSYLNKDGYAFWFDPCLKTQEGFSEEEQSDEPETDMAE